MRPNRPTRRESTPESAAEAVHINGTTHTTVASAAAQQTLRSGATLFRAFVAEPSCIDRLSARSTAAAGALPVTRRYPDRA